MDVGFVEEARKLFLKDSAYLDDRPGAPMRFRAEANLQQMIRRETGLADEGDVRAQLRDRIREVFKGGAFETVFFPGGPYDVPDDVGTGKPRLVVLSYDAVSIGASASRIPEFVRSLYLNKGAHGAETRMLRNNVVFIIASDAHKQEMRHQMCRRLALKALSIPERLQEFEGYQQAKILELEQRSALDVATAIQQCYRHVFYPWQPGMGSDAVTLEHTAIDVPSAAERPGIGQRFIKRVLRDLNKLRGHGDSPDSPAYIRDKTPLKNGQITTAALRAEFRLNPVLPILLDEEIFISGVLQGIKRGDFVYRKGELLCGPDDPMASIHVSEQAQVFTMAFAKRHGIWPRKKPKTDSKQPQKPDHDPKPSPEEKPKTVVEAEAVLKEALTILWEKARSESIKKIGRLKIRVFDAQGGLVLLGAIRSISRAEKVVTMKGGYETSDNGLLELDFRGNVADAEPLKEFLLPQLRACKSSDVEIGFELKFPNGVDVQTSEAEKLAQRLTRFSGGSMTVLVTAVKME